MRTIVISALLCGACLAVSGCAPIEFSVVVVEASEAISEAESLGADCTAAQLASLSPLTALQGREVEAGKAIASTEEPTDRAKTAAVERKEPICAAPYEYYSALEFLQKAREEVGYSEYEAAVEYAREARSMARKAKEITIRRIQERGR